MKKTHAILVMDDGETWGGVEGASICLITEEDLERLTEGDLDVNDLHPIFEMGLADYTVRNSDED